MNDPLRARLGTLSGDTLAGLYNRSYLETKDWSLDELTQLERVAALFESMDRAGKSAPLFSGELGYALFFDNSTRTKSSWAGAVSRLHAHPVIVDGTSTQVAHGETAEETGAMLGMNAHALGIRHDLILGEGNRFMRDADAGVRDYLKETGDERAVPIINLQCDIDHPTQTMADLAWLKDRFSGELAGKKVAVSWAYSPSYAKPLSVPQGLITLLPRFGMNVTLAHPEGYALMPECLADAASAASEGGGSFEVTHDMDAAFEGAHVVYPKSWGPFELMMERVAANREGDRDRMAAIEARSLEQNRQHRDWICNEKRIARTDGGNALYMHCLPADIGDEVSAAVMAKAKWDVAKEANKKVYVIMALLAAAKVDDLAGRIA